MDEPYVSITIPGLNALAHLHELNVIVKGVLEIFKTNPDIDLRDEGIKIQIHIVDGKIVCELVEEEEPVEEEVI